MMHSVVTRVRNATVRTRFVLSTLLLTATALTVSGVVAEGIQDREITERVEEDLERDADALRRLVDAGIDPSNGETLGSPADAVRTSMERIVPEPHEGVVGFVDGQLAYVSEGSDIALEDDPELLAAVAPLTTEDRPLLVRIETSVTVYRVAVTQVRADASGSPAMADAPGVDPGSPVAAQVLAYDETAELGRYQHAFTIYAWVATVAFLVVAGAASWIAGRLLRPVRVLAQAARSIGQDDLSERIPVHGTDDMAEMTGSVNAMLDRLESAFEAHTRLLDDVSHEMRTPITIVRGHLELMDPEDPQDAAEARSIALDELDRMGSLVDDLMTLAKADRPDFVTPRDVRLDELCEAVIDKATTLGDRRWVCDATAADVVIADPRRITQALLQLAANAVRYSAAGSEIGVGSAVIDGEARVWVRDEGRGIRAEDQERIFDRFGRSGDGEGLGLGLAIVAAIADAHGGLVELDSASGRGSTFTLAWPTTRRPVSRSEP